MKRLALAAVLLLVALPAAAATPTPMPASMPPAGTVIVQVWASDGTAILPLGQGVYPPLACDPEGSK